MSFDGCHIQRGGNMNNSIYLNSQDDTDSTMGLILTPAWFQAVNMFSWIDRAGLYQDPPNHRVIK